MFKKVLTICIAIMLFAQPVLASNTLWGFYTERGEDLPSLDARAQIYNNIWEDQYLGTAEQNDLLLAFLESNDEPQIGFGPSTGYSKRLSQSITAIATEIPVTSVLDRDGVTLPCSATNKCYFNLEQGTTNEEPVVCSGISGSSFTPCTRGLVATGNSETGSSTLANPHNAGSRIIMTNIAQFYSNYVNLVDDQTVGGDKSITGSTTFSILPTGPTISPWLPEQFVTKSVTDAIQATSTYWILSGNDIYYTTGKVGIGLTNPSYLLDLEGTSESDGIIAKIKSTSLSPVYNRLDIESPVLRDAQISFSEAGTTIWTIGNDGVDNRLGFKTGAGSFGADDEMTILENGDIGINTIEPLSKLHIVGTTTIQGNLISPTFGGTGLDGALNITSGTTTIDFSNANLVIKNYTSINIDAGTELTYSNKATDGSILILKSQGDCTIAGEIDLKGMGANKKTTGYSIQDDSAHLGGDGNTGNDGSEAVGTAGAIYTNKYQYVTPDADRLYRKYIVVSTGSGGGDGGAGEQAPASSPGVGSPGGGAIIIECGGSLNFVSGATINVSGDDGGQGGHLVNCSSTGGGGGGGSAGSALLLCNYLIANSGTIDASGGDGGGSGSCDALSASGTQYGGTGAGGAGNYSGAGGVGGDNDDDLTCGGAETGGNAGGAGAGAGGGGGLGNNGGAGARPSCSGGNGGVSDSNLYLVTQNLYF